MDGADVCGTSSRASRRPPNVTCGAAILDPRWRRRKWHQPGLGASFSIPIEGEVQNGDPSASGGHLGWPHLRNRKWGHPRWPPEAEGPPFCTSPSMGIEKLALYYSQGTQNPLYAIPMEITESVVTSQNPLYYLSTNWACTTMVSNMYKCFVVRINIRQLGHLVPEW